VPEPMHTPHDAGLPPRCLAIIPRTSARSVLVLHWVGDGGPTSPHLLRLTLYNQSARGIWRPRDERQAYSVSLYPAQVPDVIRALTTALSSAR